MPNSFIGPAGHREPKGHSIQDNYTHFDFIKRYIRVLHGRRDTLFFLQTRYELEIQVHLEQTLVEGLDIPAPSGTNYLQKQVAAVAFVHD